MVRPPFMACKYIRCKKDAYVEQGIATSKYKHLRSVISTGENFK